MKYSRPQARREAQPVIAEAAEAPSWTCATCPTMTEPGEVHCWHCKTYWDDVANGLFAD